MSTQVIRLVCTVCAIEKLQTNMQALANEQSEIGPRNPAQLFCSLKKRVQKAIASVDHLKTRKIIDFELCQSAAATISAFNACSKTEIDDVAWYYQTTEFGEQHKDPQLVKNREKTNTLDMFQSKLLVVFF